VTQLTAILQDHAEAGLMAQWAPSSKLDARILLHCHLGCRHTLAMAHCPNVPHARFDVLQVTLKFLAQEHFIVHCSRTAPSSPGKGPFCLQSALLFYPVMSPLLFSFLLHCSTGSAPLALDALVVRQHLPSAFWRRHILHKFSFRADSDWVKFVGALRR
jgi:hypothetical protein